MKDPSRVERIISAELRHQTIDKVELLNEASVCLEHKLLYLGLRALAPEERSSKEIDDCSKTWISNAIGGVLSVIDDIHDREKVLQLEVALGEKEQQLSALRVRMRAELRQKSEQLSQLRKQNVQLQAFADAVRRTLVYRVYHKLIRPLKGY